MYRVGCCLGLMAVLFALGVMSLFWMALIAAAIFVEKVFRHGPRLTRCRHRPDRPWAMGRSLAFDRSDAGRAWAVTVHGNGDAVTQRQLLGFKNVVFPARTLRRASTPGRRCSGNSRRSWATTSPCSQAPARRLACPRRPGVDHPLVFWEVAESLEGGAPSARCGRCGSVERDRRRLASRDRHGRRHER